ncbi:prephenate dehydrogenase [Clostridium magnum]|uniref:Prephenate dehydrogenase n=1 Tax=Clostridium magnum DSM 2767 TaxID=1121326 RepID=A0A162R3P2_9CLOT|nr:prephenate dehydrogenase [Clostridium magnum]KZL89374.1 prephenate dehydrogenase [Clostridium magnum DSM 2767]
MDECDFDFNIVIVGLGLIGGSYAMALKELKPRQICAIDMDERALEQALEIGIIDKGCKNGKSFLKEADLIIIALYPEETVKFVNDNKQNFKKSVVITDTCGIKSGIVEKINSFLPEGMDFIGGHPMAGRESKGLKSASKDIFQDANYIITPAERNKRENIELIEKMARSMGCKNVVSLTPEEHDKIISYTSHLPHVIAVSLMNSNMIENVGLFIAGSFKDATRVANINSTLWSELFALNSESLVAEIEKFEESIKEIKKAIKSEDKQNLINIFKNASEKRRKMV